MYVYFNIKK